MRTAGLAALAGPARRDGIVTARKPDVR
jgi:hypothetical protein